jgi:HD-like signal output (HDOD) protein
VTRYQAALQRHQKNWIDACRRCGALFSAVIAEKLLRDWRLDDLVAAEVLQVL